MEDPWALLVPHTSSRIIELPTGLLPFLHRAQGEGLHQFPAAASAGLSFRRRLLFQRWRGSCHSRASLSASWHSITASQLASHVPPEAEGESSASIGVCSAGVIMVSVRETVTAVEEVGLTSGSEDVKGTKAMAWALS